METTLHGSTGNAAHANIWVSRTDAAKSHPKQGVTTAGGHLGVTAAAASFRAQALLTHNAQLLSDLCWPHQSPCPPRLGTVWCRCRQCPPCQNPKQLHRPVHQQHPGKLFRWVVICKVTWGLLGVTNGEKKPQGKPRGTRAGPPKVASCFSHWLKVVSPLPSQQEKMVHKELRWRPRPPQPACRDE